MALMALVGVVVLAAAPEVPTAQSMMELAARQAAERAPPGGEAVPTGLLLAVMNQARALLSTEGLPLDGAAEEWLRVRIVDGLKAELMMLPSRPGLERRDAWERLTRRAMTPQFAQETLDAWLGLPPIAGLDRVRTEGQWTQVTQLEGGETFTLHHVDVVEEIGSDGSANKLIDPGEWVRLELAFTNATKQPWFSTTGFPQVQGCAWADGSRGAILGEAAPGAQASLSLWLFVPAGCTSPSVLKLSLADTHRGAPARSVTVEVKPMDFARPLASGLRLDTDGLGSSDGTRRDRIGPLGRFELVADVSVSSALVSRVEPRWALPLRAGGLFKSLLYRPAPAVPQGGGLFAAGDDLDGETVDPDTWRVVVQHEDLEPWLVQPAGGRLWLALDTLVSVTQPAPPPPPAAPLVPPGKLALGARPPPSPPSSTPLGTAPVPAGVVTRLVQQYVSLVPHSVPREQVEAITAASGYEVLFDKAGFARDYEALLAPPAAPPPAPPATAAYVTRTYVAVPAVAVPPLVREEEPPAPQPPPRREPPPRAPPPPLAQVDLGGGVAIFGVEGTRASPNLWTGLSAAAFPSGTLRAFVGPHFVGTVGVNLNGLSYTFGTNDAAYLEFSGDLGAGYRLRWEHLWLTPYLAATLRLRQHTHVGDREFAVGGLLGANLRVRLVSFFGLSLDVAMPFGIGGPAATGIDGTPTGIVSGIGARVSLGLSFAF